MAVAVGGGVLVGRAGTVTVGEGVGVSDRDLHAVRSSTMKHSDKSLFTLASLIRAQDR